jgi:hypothetical protein
LLQGETVKVVEEKGLWLRIEPPAVASGFVAAHLLLKTPTAVAKAEPVIEPAATNPPVVIPTPPVATEVTTNTPAVVAVDATTNAVPPPNIPVVTAPVPPDGGQQPVNLVPPAELGKRVVTREGILRGSVSIQAPAYYELRSLDNNSIVDYIWSPSTNIVLRKYKGMRVVLTGEELLDERWPKTPVISVDEISEVP